MFTIILYDHTQCVDHLPCDGEVEGHPPLHKDWYRNEGQGTSLDPHRQSVKYYTVKEV
jgi:hypothetical protein